MTPESITWNIERIWSATTQDKTEQLRTLELSRFRGLVMLGTAGAGKTTEAARLANHERASGACVCECRLAEFADTSSQLATHLRRMSRAADQNSVFYLDALDEAMIAERRRWLAIKHWVTGELQGTRASIRITCRGAIWPSGLTQFIRELAGSESFATAALQPLSDEDIHFAAASQGIAPAAFLKQIHASGARSLAAQPLSLRMLMRLHQSNHGLPAALSDLFQNGLKLLASDSEHRREIGTQNPLPPTELLKAAERLACYMILGGHDAVHLGNEPLPNQLGRQDLDATISPHELEAIQLSGVSESAAPTSFRFAHRQFAEYLAGRRLARLPIHQSRAFLANPDGWNNGVAGPLRETAAFTAMFSPGVANWIADRDPEVIGLSAVADSGLRRAATLALLRLFQRGKMTSHQLVVSEFNGLRYPDADADLRCELVSRGNRSDQRLLCAIELAGTWEISSLSDDLADLVLDSTVSIHVRREAGSALHRCGQPTARERLKPLIAGLPEDVDDELKYVALRCNWPDHLSTPELLEALTTPRGLYSTRYVIFLGDLIKDGFAATGHLPTGLRWAKAHIRGVAGRSLLSLIAMRIAHSALHHLDDPRVARELTALLNAWARHDTSPLAGLSQNGLDSLSPAERHDRAPLHTNREARRRLIDLLTAAMETRQEIMAIQWRTPGLLNQEDFCWLLGRASDEQYPMATRENYLHLACLLPWQDNTENVDAWLRVCDDEPVKSILGNERWLELDSDKTRQLRSRWKANADRSRRHEILPLDPPPRQRVIEVLRLAETTDIRHFRGLCHELTLRPTSTKSGCERFLTRTPGWREADSQVRDRIVRVAKSYLSRADVASESVRAVKPKSLHVEVMGAIWLLLERDADWLRSRPQSWWENWCWYILRQLVRDLADEPQEPKHDILKLLNENSPATVRQDVTTLASSQDDEFAKELSSLLRLLMNAPNRELDEGLCAALCAGEIAKRSATPVAEFVFSRAADLATQACLDVVQGAGKVADETVEHVAVALLRRRPREAWPSLQRLLRAWPERGHRILNRVNPESEPDFVESLLESLLTAQAGELAEILIELFPFSTDREGDHFHYATPDGAARRLRDELLQRLATLESADAVTALRRLERRFDRYAGGLRLLRSKAERGLRLSRWAPFPVGTVKDVLEAGERRLIRSEQDAVDGIECAVKRWETPLLSDSGQSREEVWNTATGAIPTPKPEEHLSSILCAAVQEYFRDYAVAADREVEISRRNVGRAHGGEPGSRVDVLVRVPGRGTTTGDAIRVPIEVKLSCNDEAKTAMRVQLADRYMRQLRASHGIYIVVWMSLPNREDLQPSHRPVWPSIEAAEAELQQQAERLAEEEGTEVRAIVVDGSLR